MRGNTMARNWCFTEFERSSISFNNEMKYLVYQMEETPKTGKMHLQGYVQFKSRHKLGAVKELLESKTIHIEKARGSADENKAYCTKEDTRVMGPWEFGVMTRAGQRSDLSEAGALAIEGKWLEIDPEVFIKYHKGLHALASIHHCNKERKLSVDVFWGPTGTGKSFKALKETELCDSYWKPPGPWWDGYRGQKIVVIDDFDPLDHNVSDVLRWLDVYPLQVPIKGGFVWLECEKIIITSHFNPVEWYPLRKDELIRRINGRLVHSDTAPPT